MPVSIAELGNSLRCPKDDCDRFGKIIKLQVSDKVTLSLICEKHMKKYRNAYSVNQFVRMAESALIEDEWIRDFQKKYLIQYGRFIPIKGGMEGAFVVKNQEKIRALGKELLCKCDSIANVTFEKVKKDKTQVRLYCAECMPKGKKKWFRSVDIIELAKAGLIDNNVAQKVRDMYEDDGEQFDVSESYSVGKGIMSSWVQEDLGMLDEDTQSKKCYICGTILGPGMDRCPKCGSDL